MLGVIYIFSISAWYFLETYLLFNFSVGVSKPASTLKSSGSIMKFWTLWARDMALLLAASNPAVMISRILGCFIA